MKRHTIGTATSQTRALWGVRLKAVGGGLSPTPHKERGGGWPADLAGWDMAG
jgi:hypothetical protein